LEENFLSTAKLKLFWFSTCFVIQKMFSSYCLLAVLLETNCLDYLCENLFPKKRHVIYNYINYSYSLFQNSLPFSSLRVHCKTIRNSKTGVSVNSAITIKPRLCKITLKNFFEILFFILQFSDSWSSLVM